MVNPTENSPTVGPRIVLRDVLAHEVYLRMRDIDNDHWIVAHVDVAFAAFNNQELARYCFAGRAILGPSTSYKLPLTQLRGAAPVLAARVQPWCSSSFFCSLS